MAMTFKNKLIPVAVAVLVLDGWYAWMWFSAGSKNTSFIGSNGRIEAMEVDVGTKMAGRRTLSSEVRIVLDAAPDYAIPAKISFIASVAQFTPKTLEAASEREKLMFRVRAQIDRELLNEHLESVKTDLPGENWVRFDSSQAWSARLALKVRQ